ncbi:MAG: glycosyltransferase family 4 protein [Parcubacteria group bacterium]|nr:glycosyltransferase family 4 protein [Parcubacteria group bacterium]
MKGQIAQVVCSYPPDIGGMGTVAHELSSRLRARGYHISTFCHKRKAADARQIGWFQSGNATFAPDIFFSLQRFDRILLHYPFFGAAEFVWLLRKIFPQKKLFLYYHMDFIAKNVAQNIASAPLFFVTPSLFSMSEKIFFSTKDFSEHCLFRKEVFLNRKKIRESPFGVNDDFIPDPAFVRGVKHNPVMLFVAGLDGAHRFKGLEVLLCSVGFLVRSFPKLTLRICGDGDMRPHYENMVRQKRLEKNVIFLGTMRQHALISEYQHADLFILPSTTQGEAFGLVLLEAMACGTPVIASDLPGVSVIAQNGGCTARSGDTQDLAKNITKVLSSSALMSEYSKRGITAVEENYRWPRIIDRLEKNLFEL